MEKYNKACLEIDKIHWKDKNFEIDEGINYPAEMLYAIRMVKTLEGFAPDSTEKAKLAARCQHFKRWEIARSEYSMDKVGYLKWRKALYIYQSEEAAKVLKQVGYGEDFIDDFKILIQKKEMKYNKDSQLIEDVACLVFLNYYLNDFSKKHETEKLKSIIAKTWAKMSDKAKSSALKIELPENLKKIIAEVVKS